MKTNTSSPKPNPVPFSDLASTMRLQSANDVAAVNDTVYIFRKKFENSIVKHKIVAANYLDKCFATNVEFIDCSFLQSKFKDSLFKKVKFTRCAFKKCNFQEADFDSCEFDTVVFEYCEHFETSFYHSEMKDVSFSHGSCSSFIFTDCNYSALKASNVDILPRVNCVNGINGVALYSDIRPDAGTTEALLNLGAVVEYKEGRSGKS